MCAFTLDDENSNKARIPENKGQKMKEERKKKRHRKKRDTQHNFRASDIDSIFYLSFSSSCI